MGVVEFFVAHGLHMDWSIPFVAGVTGQDPNSSLDRTLPTNWLHERVQQHISSREATRAAQLPWWRENLSNFLKRMKNDANPPAPIRISIEYQLEALGDEQKKRFLRNKLLPAMIAELVRHVKVMGFWRPDEWGHFSRLQPIRRAASAYIQLLENNCRYISQCLGGCGWQGNVQSLSGFPTALCDARIYGCKSSVEAHPWVSDIMWENSSVDTNCATRRATTARPTQVIKDMMRHPVDNVPLA